MKKSLLILSGLLAVIHVFGQQEKSPEAACNCPSCIAAASGEKLPYTLPGLQGLNEESATNARVEHNAQEHKEDDLDHAVESADHYLVKHGWEKGKHV